MIARVQRYRVLRLELRSLVDREELWATCQAEPAHVGGDVLPKGFAPRKLRLKIEPGQLKLGDRVQMQLGGVPA